MAQVISVRLSKGDAPSLGFRLQGGKDFGTPLLVQKVNIGSPAEKAGLLAGDSVIKINATDVYNLRHKDAQDVIIRAGPSFEITIQRGGATWKPSVTPVPKIVANSYSPVTKTSLAAKPQASVGSIGTTHNLSAKPFSPQLNGTVNGGPKLVNKQYNTPLGLYSEESIAETLSAQAEVLSTGVLGVNFKKNEKNYDASTSAVFRMVQEADKEPREQETEPDSGVVTATLGVGGLRHVQAPENKPISSTPQLPPGQNICAECERLIVGVFVRIKDKNLHVECFKCATCGTSLKNVGYYNINQKLYCDVHAKLAAKSNPPGPNLIPVTVLPGSKAPVGTISTALATHALPVSAPLSPNLGSSNTTAQPFQGGTSFSSPRPFSSVSAPLSSPGNTYSTLPVNLPSVQSHSSPAPSSEKSRPISNVIWPPPIDSEQSVLPTATPLYFPPPSQITPKETKQKAFVNQKQITNIEESNTNKPLNITRKSAFEEFTKVEDLKGITEDMEAKMSLCSTEVASIINRQVAVERIETAAETQMFVESILQQRPKSPPPSQSLEPKVEVETQPLISSEKTDSNAPSNVPRVITKVCVCTNSCCNANTGELCEDCPMRDLKRPKDYQKCKLKPVENSIPKRFGSPIITGVSVTINNPGKIKEAVKDLFTQIPDKKTASALGSALVTAPKEPFTPIDSCSAKPISLPQETKPYLPPERPVISEPKPQPIPKVKVQAPDTPLVSALRIAPDRPFTPVNIPACIKERKPKEDPLFKDLPKPVQWMSMVSALTTAPDRPYSPFVTESSVVQQRVETTVSTEEINKIKESQQKIMKRSVHNETALPKPYTPPHRLEKFEPINDSKVIPELRFPPVSDELKYKRELEMDYSKVKDEISTQIIEQTHIDELYLSKTKFDPKEKKSVEQQDENKSKSKETLVSKGSNEQKLVEKQTEETVLKKPLELVGHLQKREYLPQYQLSLRYDETIQLPHRKDIKKLLDNQNKQTITQNRSESLSCTKEATSHYVAASSKQVSESKNPTVTIQNDRGNISTQEVVFKPVREDKSPCITSSPRPRPLTPSMINKPAPILPYYQESLVPTQMPPPEVNILDPKSPNISRSPSPSPYYDRPSSPFGRLSPRPVSPAAGPPPNPLKSGQFPRKVTQESFKIQEAKRNISQYIPQYREKVDGIELVSVTQSSKLDATNANVTADSNIKVQPKYKQSTNVSSDTLECNKQIKIQESSSRSQSLTASKLNLSTDRKVNRSDTSKTQSLYPFQNVKNPDVTEPSIMPVHLTNPQSISSQFTSLQKDQIRSECLLKNRGACSTSNQPNATEQDPSLTKNTPCVSVSTPTVSHPNVGAGGGRQAGAIGVAPKRGRGILNVGGLIGSRIPMCGHCHGQIRGPFITALGKIWCPEHFICNTVSCKRPLQDLGFVEEQGQLYCEYCFEQYIAPPCAKCGSKIKGDCLKAIGKNFHPECFSCSYCGKLFGNSPFFLEDGQPYCENDWNELFTTKCFACGFPVEAGDRWVEALNNNYHSQCFNCTMCKKNLEGQSFFAKGGRPFCKNHAR